MSMLQVGRPFVMLEGLSASSLLCRHTTHVFVTAASHSFHGNEIESELNSRMLQMADVNIMNISTAPAAGLSQSS